MKTNKNTLASMALAAAAVALPSTGSAQQPHERGWYLGGSVGSAQYEKSCNGLAIVCEDSDTAKRFFIGRQFNDHIAFEAGYADLGAVEGAGDISGPADFKRKVRALDLSLLVSTSMADWVSFYGRLGIARSETEVTGTLLGAAIDVNERSGGFTFGVGAQLNLGRHIGLRAEWQRYPRTGGPALEPLFPKPTDDIDVYAVGARIRF